MIHTDLQPGAPKPEPLDTPAPLSEAGNSAPAPAWMQLAAEDLQALAWLHEAERAPEQLIALSSSGFPGALSLVVPQSAACQAMSAALHALAEPAAAAELASNADELAADFAAIYLTHGLRAAPYESVWRDEDHLMMQEPTFAVRDFYHRHGVTVSNWRHMPDDHLTHELNFVALLLSRNEPREAARFLGQHLLAWLTEFTRRVTQRAQTPFYAALAALTLECCEQCQTRLPRVVLMPAIKATASSPACGP